MILRQSIRHDTHDVGVLNLEPGAACAASPVRLARDAHGDSKLGVALLAAAPAPRRVASVAGVTELARDEHVLRLRDDTACLTKGDSGTPIAERERLELGDGSRLILGVRAISGAHEIGFYMGRLLTAIGRVSGQGIEVRDPDRLAFFGSTRSWAEMAIPTLAVRTSEHGAFCGFVFDASQWGSEGAVDGYMAHRMTCDERLGEELPLPLVRCPDRYSLP